MAQVTLNNYTWDDFRVLGIWDMTTASDFGHILLEPTRTLDAGAGEPQVAPPTVAMPPSPFPSEALAPGPAPESSTTEGHGTQIIRGESQPTMFENCAQLSPSIRLRWTVNWGHGSVDIGLETPLAKSEYISFGWASALSKGHYMINSDVVIAGFNEEVRGLHCTSRTSSILCAKLHEELPLSWHFFPFRWFSKVDGLWDVDAIPLSSGRENFCRMCHTQRIISSRSIEHVTGIQQLLMEFVRIVSFRMTRKRMLVARN